MNAQKNPDELYKAAIQNEREALSELDHKVQLKLKNGKAVKVRRIIYYSSVAAAIALIFLIFRPSVKQERQLKAFQTMVNNMEFQSVSEVFKIDIQTTQIDRLNRKIEEMKKDDMITRLNEKMKKYKQQNKQL